MEEEIKPEKEIKRRPVKWESELNSEGHWEDRKVTYEPPQTINADTISKIAGTLLAAVALIISIINIQITNKNQQEAINTQGAIQRNLIAMQDSNNKINHLLQQEATQSQNKNQDRLITIQDSNNKINHNLQEKALRLQLDIVNKNHELTLIKLNSEFISNLNRGRIEKLTALFTEINKTVVYLLGADITSLEFSSSLDSLRSGLYPKILLLNNKRLTVSFEHLLDNLTLYHQTFKINEMSRKSYSQIIELAYLSAKEPEYYQQIPKGEKSDDEVQTFKLLESSKEGINILKRLLRELYNKDSLYNSRSLFFYDYSYDLLSKYMNTVEKFLNEGKLVLDTLEDRVHLRYWSNDYSKIFRDELELEKINNQYFSSYFYLKSQNRVFYESIIQEQIKIQFQINTQINDIIDNPFFIQKE